MSGKLYWTMLHLHSDYLTTQRGKIYATNGPRKDLKHIRRTKHDQ